VVTLPAEAFLGGAVPLIVIAVIALAIFALVANWVGRRFARDAAAASGADTIRTRKGRTEARFGASMVRATIGKEFKLLLRDPGLVSQVLLRVFYVIPLGFVILTDTGEINSIVPSIAAGAAALLAGQLAGSIAWLTLSAEDSPELLASAPIPIRAFWRAKLAVSFLIPAALLALPLIALTFLNPVAGLVGIVAAAASAWSAAMINLWLQKPTKRSEFRRSWSSTLGANLLELSTSAAIAAAAGMAVAGLVSAWIPAALAIGIVLLARRSEAAVLERLTGAA
jgi:ABC-2 type transport system permease protein